MKLRFLMISFFILRLFAPISAFCADATIALSSHPMLEIDVQGSLSIKVGPEGTMTARSSAAVSKDAFDLEKTLQGAKLAVYKNASVEITVPESTQIKLEAKNAAIQAQGLTAPFSVEAKNATVSLDGFRGAIDIKFKSGAVDLKNYSGEGKTVAIEGKNGTVSASIGAFEVGPGKIQLENGMINLAIDRKSKIAVHAAVSEKGSVETSLPITRTSPKDAYFTANEGKFLWELKLVKGNINLDIPRP